MAPEALNWFQNMLFTAFFKPKSSLEHSVATLFKLDAQAKPHIEGVKGFSGPLHTWIKLDELYGNVFLFVVVC